MPNGCNLHTSTGYPLIHVSSRGPVDVFITSTGHPLNYVNVYTHIHAGLDIKASNYIVQDNYKFGALYGDLIYNLLDV